MKNFKYVSSTLSPNERIIRTAELHWIIFAPAFMLFGMCLAFLVYALAFATVPVEDAMSIAVLSGASVLAPVVIAIGPMIAQRTIEFVITSNRLCFKSGLIRRSTEEIPIDKIESVSVYQGIIGRFLNFGEVRITGTGGAKMKASKIIDPVAFRRDAIDAKNRWEDAIDATLPPP